MQQNSNRLVARSQYTSFGRSRKGSRNHSRWPMLVGFPGFSHLNFKDWFLLNDTSVFPLSKGLFEN